MNAAQKRIAQINAELQELGDLALTPDLTRSQRNSISVQVRALIDERTNLEDNRNHWLAETQQSLGDVVALVQKEIRTSSSKILGS